MIFLAFFSPLDCLALLDKSSALTPLAPSPPLTTATSTPLESLSLSAAASFLGSSKLTFFVASISVNSGMFPAITHTRLYYGRFERLTLTRNREYYKEKDNFYSLESNVASRTTNETTADGLTLSRGYVRLGREKNVMRTRIQSRVYKGTS